ncbi:AAA family ATPase [Deinococcus aestuarii]|uniref:AAA family ATPase n=1 Tax=Deinococcus aestuarii TaxID=2774531 RepID=UPI001C0B7054
MFEVSVENYRRYRDRTTVRFRPGLTVISGENGAGKSTLTEAILHALFGAKSGENPQADGSQQPYQVNFNFQGQGFVLDVHVRGNHHQVDVNGTRLVRFGSGSLKSARQVLGQHLGRLDRKRFALVYFAVQGETQVLVSLAPGQRKALLEDVLQLDVVKAAVNLQKAAVDAQIGEVQSKVQGAAHAAAQHGVGGELDQRAAALRRSTSPHTRQENLGAFMRALDQAIASHDERRAAKADALDAAQTDLAFAKAHEENCQKTCRDLEGQDRALDVVRLEKASAAGAVQAARATVQEIERTVAGRLAALDAARAAEPLARQYEAATRRVEHLTAERLQHAEERAVARRLAEATGAVVQAVSEFEQYDGLDAALAAGKQALAQAEQHCETFGDDPHSARLGQLEQRLDTLEAMKADQKSALLALGRTDEPQRCPTCGEALSREAVARLRATIEEWLQSTYPGESEQLRREREVVVAKQQHWASERKAAVAQRKAVQGQCQANEIRNARRASALEAHQAALELERDARVACLDRGIELPFDEALGDDLERRWTVVREEAERCEAAHASFAQVATLLTQWREDSNRLDVARCDVVDLERRESAVRYDGSEHEAVLHHLSEARLASQQAAKRGAEAEGAVTQAEEALASADAAAAQLALARRDVEREYDVLVREERLHVHLGKFQEHFFNVNTAQVMRRATELMRQATRQAIRALELDGDGKLFYWDQFLARHTANRLSGGEQALAGLCIRLALAERAQAISSDGRVRFLVLDEVLGSLDDERRRQVQSIFDAVLASGTFDYIVMITHLDEVKNNWAAHRIEIIHDPVTGTSRATTLPSTS